ncbi:MAG: tartrate-resistant acid phosphatase type 5 family protein [Thermoanaerobaculia bacterium]|nr:tartrate-resistant acid phosphatase type 5 family protein [Thermoanaerobaculia bacterium]
MRPRLSLVAAFLAAAVLGGAAALSQGEPAAPPLTFLAIGDWGRGGEFGQRDVAAQMGAFAERSPVRFIVSTGDNFYEYGVKSAADPLWKRSFEDVYTAKSLMVPWYVALGNHDHRGSAAAEIEYGKTSPRWRMPDLYYTLTEKVSATSMLQLFVLDTSPFISAYRGSLSVTKVAGLDPKTQLAWLEKELANSNASWKIVVGHHPVYSAGEHGNTRELIRDVKPLLERYGVRIYLNGHDHDLQHLREGAVHYFTSGAGSKTNEAGRDPRTLFSRGKTPGFMAFSVGEDAMNVTVVDSSGKTLYTAIVAR